MGYAKGHYGEYSGNSKFSHAHTKVTKENYKASERDDAAHIDYLKRDVLYDDHHGHSDEKMTADEKHISKLAGDMKYDKQHHGSPATHKYPEKHAHEKWQTGPKKGQYKTSPRSARYFKGFRPPEYDGKNHGGDNKAAKDIEKDS